MIGRLAVGRDGVHRRRRNPLPGKERQRRFGERFDEFCRKVPRWIPRLTPAYEGPLRHGFDVARAFKKEHNPFAAWASGALVLLAWEQWRRGTLTREALFVLAGLQATVLVFFISVKAWKHDWLRRLA